MRSMRSAPFSWAPLVGRVLQLGVLWLLLGAWALAAQPREWRVGVLCWSNRIPGQMAMLAGVQAEAASINRQARAAGLPTLRLEVRVAGDGEAGIENQIRQMRAFITTDKVDLILVQPTDNAALAGALREANRAGIPVVAYDQYISGGTLAAYRSSDNYQAGFLGGEYIAARFPPDKVIRLVLVEYPHVSSTVERVNGFLDALDKARRTVKVLKSYSAVEPVGGRKVAQDLLRDFPAPGSVDALFTVNDGGGLEVVKGLLAAGRSEILVATVDGDPAAIEHIRSGQLTVIDAAQFCGPLGAEAMRAAHAVLSGRPTPYHALVPTFPVTRETLKRYPGWQGPLPAAFEKPWKSVDPLWRGELRILTR